MSSWSATMPTSARLMGVNVASVKTRAFVLVGVMAVFAGLMTSIYGYYFWPTTGDGFLLNTIASVFLGGTSVFGGTGIDRRHLRRLLHHRRDQRRHRLGRHQRLLHPALLRTRDRALGRAADHHRAPGPPPTDHRALAAHRHSRESGIQGLTLRSSLVALDPRFRGDDGSEESSPAVPVCRRTGRPGTVRQGPDGRRGRRHGRRR